MRSPTATHTGSSNTLENEDRAFNYLFKSLVTARISTKCCERLARVFCLHTPHKDFNNRLQCLRRGLMAEDDLCALAQSPDEKDVHRLVCMTVRELAPKAKKEQRARHDDTALQNMKYDEQFKKDVIDTFDKLDKIHSCTRRGRLTYGGEHPFKVM